MIEKDLEIYDVWESPNGNLFIKISNEYSIGIGQKGFHEPSAELGEFHQTQFVKADNITPVKKIGRLNFDNDMDLTITKEKVLIAAEKNPQSKKLLECLFPEAFENNKVYCRIGTILRRKKYPNYIYTLFKWNGEVRLLNLTLNSMWKSDRNIKVSKLKDINGETITFGEFESLVEKSRVDDFVLIKNDEVKSI